MNSSHILKLAFIVSLPLAFKSQAIAAAKFNKRVESPEVFLIKQTERTLSQAKSIPPRASGDLVLEASATKSDWLASLYDKNIIDASDYSAALSDKLMMTNIFSRVLGETQANQYLPKTLGLKQFLERHQLVDSKGRVLADGDKIDSALYEEFPTGFFVRPAVGITPFETEKGLFSTPEQLIVELVKGKSTLYDPLTYWIPIKSHILNRVVSGEAVVLQENLIVSADLKGRLKNKNATLVRVHSFEQKIIPNSLPKRWVADDASDSLSRPQIEGAEKFAQKFLNDLPESILRRQAWSIEIAAFDNGTYRIANILTNRGKRIAWSSYLDQPRILEAYTDYFESDAGLQFEGFGGRLLRWGIANYFTYWKLRFEKAQGWRKITAAFPPLL